MNENRIQNVYIVGRGAVGLAFGSQFQESMPEHFAYIVDANRKARYEQEGILVNGKPVDFTYITPQDPAPKADVLLITTKMSGLDAAMDLAEPFIDENTLILSGINGIASEDILRARFGENQVIRAIAQMMDARYQGNRVDFTTCGELVFGPENEIQKAHCQRLHAFFDSVPFVHVCSDNIVHDAWKKLMLNCGLNQICAAYGYTYGDVVEKPEALAMFVKAMQEVQAVAASQNVTLEDAEIAQWVEGVRSLSPDSMPSMAQDMLAQRKTEKALFSGTVVPMGHAAGIDVSTLEKLYDLVSEKEADF